MGKGAELRREIVGGESTFAAAAEKYSEGPSRRSGGDLGFIPRHERMVETFSKAAFALAKDEISPPIVTPFGVHLIQCTDVRSGTKSWTDVRSELAAAYAQDQFHKLADEMRPTVMIEYNPAVPHLDAKTGRAGKRTAGDVMIYPQVDSLVGGGLPSRLASIVAAPSGSLGSQRCNWPSTSRARSRLPNCSRHKASPLADSCKAWFSARQYGSGPGNPPGGIADRQISNA